MTIHVYPPQHADIGNGHFMVSSAHLDDQSLACSVETHLTTTNKLAGFHGGVTVKFYGQNHDQLGHESIDYGIGQAPVFSAGHEDPPAWNLTAPAGTQALGLAQYWSPHWPLGTVGDAIGGYFTDVIAAVQDPAKAANDWAVDNPAYVGLVVFGIIIFAATILCLESPACEVVIGITSVSGAFGSAVEYQRHHEPPHSG